MPEGRIVISGLMLGIFVAMVGMAFTFAPGARMLPLVIGIPGVILTAMQFYTELRSKESKRASSEHVKREMTMIGWFLIFVVGILCFGFIYGAPVLIASYLYFSWKEKWYTALISMALAYVVLNFVFQEFIGIILFEGLILLYLFY